MIRWSRTALRDFQAIHRWIAFDDPAAAHRQCVRIHDAISQLENFPLLGQEHQSQDKRTITVPGTQFTIFYWIKPDAIFVRAIRHGAQSRPPRLQP